MPRRFFSGWSSPNRPAPAARPHATARFGTGFESLEVRDVPAVVLAPLSDAQASNTAIQIPTDRPAYIPVTVANTPNGAVTTAVNSDNAGVAATVLQGGRSVRFDISGTDGSGNPFTGSVTIRLFEDVAPLATQRIVDLVNSGYYNGKIFHRVADLFGPGAQDNVIIQGGSPTGNGTGGSTLPDFIDEFNAGVTFGSNGLVAFANAGDDNNNAQFFFTDSQRPLADQVAFLNFNHTIFGIVTSGYDTLRKMKSTQLSGTTPTNPLTITGAAVFTDTANAVVKLTPFGTFTGTANIAVTATDADGVVGQAVEAFSATGTAVGTNSRAFLNPVAPVTTTTGTPVTVALPVTDLENDTLTFDVRGASSGFTGAPTNFTFSINATTRQLTITPNAGFTGSEDFKIGVRDQTDRSGAGLTDPSNFDTQVVRLTVNAPPATPTPTPTPPALDPTAFTAEGSAAGVGGAVTVRNQDGSVRFTVPVFDLSFTGGVRVAVGDVTNDGVKDIVAVPGFGGGPIVLILDSNTGAVLRTITLFDPAFRGGLHVQVGDAAGLGYDQILIGAGDSGGPRITLLDVVQRQTLLNFFAGDPNVRGGVSLDLAEVFRGRGQTIIAGTGPGIAPTVFLYRGADGLLVGSFAAGDPTDLTGIRVRAGDADATTGVRPIFVAPVNAPDGTGETQYDPSKTIDPDKPAGAATSTPSTASSTNPSGFDVSSLFSR